MSKPGAGWAWRDGFCALAAAALATAAVAQPARPWMNRALSPDARASMVVSRMTLDEKIGLVTGEFGRPRGALPAPARSLGSAGFIHGIPRLGIPDIQETDAGLGVAWAHGARPNRRTTSLPAGLATAATWNPDTAYQGGAMIGREARAFGFNVMLAGGINLAREPRNGRNFEYGGEDPLLAGVIVGSEIKGIQDQGIVSTIKHYALNDQESGRFVVSSDISEKAARESDLLAFEIAIERADPGSVMCAYNRVNGTYACENRFLLNRVLKDDWRYPGWVMSDWGAVHSTVPAAMNGLDQESAGQAFDDKLYFGDALKRAVQRGEIPPARLDDMVHRVLRSLFAKGVIDDPVAPGPVDFAADGAASRRDAEQGAVLLKNLGLLPLAPGVRRIAVIGGHADVGVLSGGGSSQVVSPGTYAPPENISATIPRPVIYHASSPLKALRAAMPGAQIRFADGSDPAAAARLAADSDVAIVFATQWMTESQDALNLSLPEGQDALISAVAAANPRTVAVLETGGPVLMPWLGRVGAVLEAWYPGSSGGEAIASLLTGRVSPSGRLPITFPVSERQLPRPVLETPPAPKTPFDVNYFEGAAVGYKWYDEKGLDPLFPFGFGLSYTRFAYGNLSARFDRRRLTVAFDVTNAGERPGADTPQVYLGFSRESGEAPKRLIGWSKTELAPGQTRHVEVRVDPRMLAVWDQAAQGWRVVPGEYPVMLGSSSRDLPLQVRVSLPELRLRP